MRGVTTNSDAIWNRAAMDGGGTNPLPGDQALASLLRLHSLAMSGGLLDAVERLSPAELDAALVGYQEFDLPDAASTVAHVRSELIRDDLSEDDLDAVEAEADERYAEVIPMDAVIVDRFERRLASGPDDFAPI
jgi:hypothetical protein